MITLENIVMRFGGLHAVDDVSFAIDKGVITGLIGPNGAGKTTLFNIIAGRLFPTSGRVLLEGEDITHLPPHVRSRKGLARTFQIPHEFGGLTVLENLMVSGDTSQGENAFNAVLRRGLFLREERAVYERARDTLDFLELSPVKNEKAGNLSGGQKKLLELGRTLMREPRLILLDEIGAGINRTLLGKIAEKIKRLNAERGFTFCLIEHDLDYVSRLCSDVIVMAQGSLLTRGTIEEVRQDEDVIEAYFGGGKYEVGL
ncbi:ABC transporter ATP-binding protein [Nordella sp. HKS 07]|uniref:ABC transporter ATP-binding protein n=1 Tax=Nordella sp. HKS 07 TaxID=2712222 RepID=UPI0013E12AB6|nr:ABC transporter ATP-binding protein [Nordella sp. HKS 07]QIG52024.1 ABC transporter ATP-binding protein [Nordella sp. HKS 07]